VVVETSPEKIDGRSQGRRQEESERKRQRILEAARRCFGDLGFSGAKIGTIALEAGVSNGLLYQFFRSKEQLFEVVVEELMIDWVHAMLAPPADPAADHAARLEAMFRNSVAFTRSHPLLPALLTEDAILELSRFSDLGQRRLDAYREHVAGMLRVGVEAGEFRADLDVASVADIICQLQTDYSARAYRRTPGDPLTPQLIDAAVRFIRDAVRR
jgi:AcrR family transcriptional regulator